MWQIPDKMRPIEPCPYVDGYVLYGQMGTQRNMVRGETRIYCQHGWYPEGIWHRTEENITEFMRHWLNRTFPSCYIVTLIYFFYLARGQCFVGLLVVRFARYMMFRLDAMWLHSDEGCLFCAMTCAKHRKAWIILIVIIIHTLICPTRRREDFIQGYRWPAVCISHSTVDLFLVFVKNTMLPEETDASRRDWLLREHRLLCGLGVSLGM